jgi:hypothetical protein
MLLPDRLSLTQRTGEFITWSLTGLDFDGGLAGEHGTAGLTLADAGAGIGKPRNGMTRVATDTSGLIGTRSVTATRRRSTSGTASFSNGQASPTASVLLVLIAPCPHPPGQLLLAREMQQCGCPHATCCQ